MMNRTILSLLILLLLPTGCVDENAYSPDSPDEKETGKVLSFGVTIPAEYEPATYGMTAREECRVDSIEVLGFTVSDNKLVFRTRVTTISDTDEENKKAFKVTVPYDGSYTNVYMMLIANCPEVDSVGIVVGSSTKASVEQSVVVRRFTSLSSTDTSGKWTVPANPYRPFPMWGQTGTVNLAADEVTIPDVTLLRSLARVDVGVNYDANDKGQGLGGLFVLKSVHLCNTSDRIQVVPTTANLESLSKVASPSVPIGAGSYSRIDYAVPSDQPYEFNNEIYIAEHAKGEEGKYAANPCVIIGAQYNGSSTTTYYRVDFAKDGTTYLDILRNHRYKINILSVSGAGMSTITEALNTPGRNLVVDVVCTDNNIVHVNSDGIYLLGTDLNSFEISKQAKDMEVAVMTTVPTGWTASKTADWLTLTTSSGATGTSALKFSAAANASGSDRTATITLTAGKMVSTITVKQKAIDDISIQWVQDWYFLDGEEMTLSVKSAYDWSVKVSSDPYNLLKAYDPKGTANGASDTTAYKFKLINDMTTVRFDNKATVLTFYSPKGEFADKQVTITGRSNVDLLLSEGLTTVGFLVSEGKVTSSLSITNVTTTNATAWTAASNTHNARLGSTTLTVTILAKYAQGVASEIDSILSNDKYGSRLSVAFTDSTWLNYSNYTRTATVTVPASYTGGEAIDVRFRFKDKVSTAVKTTDITVNAESTHNGWAGSNIYWDATNSRLTFDDVDNANIANSQKYHGVFFKWGSLWGISPAGDWVNNSTVVYRSSGVAGGHTFSTAASWGIIPGMIAGDGTDRNSKYVTEQTNETNINAGRGDICKYLGTVHDKTWRMPTSYEFGEAIAYHSYTVSGTFSMSGTATADGQFINTNAPGYYRTAYSKNATSPTHFFPAAGARNPYEGLLYNIGSVGRYWSSSVNDISAYYMNFEGGFCSPNYSSDRFLGQSVRCVAEK